MGERLTLDQVNGEEGWGHKVRYRLASGFVEDFDVVLDAACGIAYGAEFFPDRCTYYGVDQIANPHLGVGSIVADLETWEVPFAFDVGISFETIEHLDDFSNLILQLKKARKWIITSVPVVPTIHINEWHKHDFQPLELSGYFEDEDWELYQYLGQPQELSEIYIFKRRDYNGK